MKVEIFVPADKRGKKGELILTTKKIGEFEINEPKYSRLKQLGLFADKRFDIEFVREDGKLLLKDEKPVVKSLEINTEAFVKFYGEVLKASGISEDDIVKYGFKNADIALEQIYLSWIKDEKK